MAIVTTAPAPEKLLYTRVAAAGMLSISVRSLDYLVANKTITIRRIGSRVLIPYGELKRLAHEDHPFSIVGGE